MKERNRFEGKKVVQLVFLDAEHARLTQLGKDKQISLPGMIKRALEQQKWIQGLQEHSRSLEEQSQGTMVIAIKQPDGNYVEVMPINLIPYS